MIKYHSKDNSVTLQLEKIFVVQCNILFRDKILNHMSSSDLQVWHQIFRFSLLKSVLLIELKLKLPV